MTCLKNYISDCMYGVECMRVGVMRDEAGRIVYELNHEGFCSPFYQEGVIY